MDLTTWITSLSPNLSLKLLKPGLLLVACIISTIFTLHLPTKLHRFFLLPTWLLAAWSLASIDGDKTSSGPIGLDSYTAIGDFILMLILPRILFFERHSLTTTNKLMVRFRKGRLVLPTRRSISAACRIWNNPRRLVFRRPCPKAANWSAAFRFAVLRGAKVAVIIFVDQWIVRSISDNLFRNTNILDFTPDRHPIIRPLLYQLFAGCTGNDCFYDSVTKQQLLMRLFLSVSWIWTNYVIIETWHAILSITCVLILHLDNPEDWPPLFGNLAECFTVKRFWGCFWHRLATPTLMTCVRAIFPKKPRTGLQKAFVAFGVFFLSGIMHMIAAWRTDEGFIHLDLVFFCANFLVIAAEVLVWGIISRTRLGALLRVCMLVLKKKSWVRFVVRLLGYIWVFAWFFWMAPRWVYPKVMHKSIKQALIESRSRKAWYSLS